jgi:hypothetical protein
MYNACQYSGLDTHKSFLFAARKSKFRSGVPRGLITLKFDEGDVQIPSSALQDLEKYGDVRMFQDQTCLSYLVLDE